VLERATESGRTLLTFDSDFGTLAVRDDIAAPFGIIFPRLKRMTIAEQTDRVHGIIVTMDAIGSTLVVIEETKVRYRDLRLKD
jgi:predicted nuclease of predicted toxin-antitoxin system